MTVDVTDLAEWRRRRDAVSVRFEGDEPAICPCGSWFFELRSNHPHVPPHGAVTLRVDGTVSGYAGQPICVACDKPLILR